MLINYCSIIEFVNINNLFCFLEVYMFGLFVLILVLLLLDSVNLLKGNKVIKSFYE